MSAASGILAVATSSTVEPDTLLGIKAFRKVEFVVSCDCFLNTTAQYADIVLPMVMQWEHPANFSQHLRTAKH